ncbi:hypothetical protein Rcae01_06103 [Novipirellula caenicola]|uniref:Uncharacterized protein n=1 Tax=Novipirellula caenicola TaxID=1536901 RepID=A0ABP9W3U7_9BACT
MHDPAISRYAMSTASGAPAVGQSEILTSPCFENMVSLLDSFSRYSVGLAHVSLIFPTRTLQV